MSKRSDQLFDYLVQISSNVHEAAVLFEKGIKDLRDPAEFAASVKKLETRGDELTSGLITLLNGTYITPLDREDFLELAVKMDDVIDGLEACTVRFDLYHITTTTQTMVDFARTIVESTEEMTQAIQKLHARKLLEIRQHAVRVNQLEKQGDEVLRNSLRALFQEGANALEVIKLKEVYEILEDVTDRCEDVADVLESVIVKNA